MQLAVGRLCAVWQCAPPLLHFEDEGMDVHADPCSAIRQQPCVCRSLTHLQSWCHHHVVHHMPHGAHQPARKLGSSLWTTAQPQQGAPISTCTSAQARQHVHTTDNTPQGICACAGQPTNTRRHAAYTARDGPNDSQPPHRARARLTCAAACPRERRSKGSCSRLLRARLRPEVPLTRHTAGPWGAEGRWVAGRMYSPR